MSFLAYSLSVSLSFLYPHELSGHSCCKEIDSVSAFHKELLSSYNTCPVVRPFIQALNIPPFSMLRMNFRGHFFLQCITPKTPKIAYLTLSDKNVEMFWAFDKFCNFGLFRIE